MPAARRKSTLRWTPVIIFLAGVGLTLYWEHSYFSLELATTQAAEPVHIPAIANGNDEQVELPSTEEIQGKSNSQETPKEEVLSRLEIEWASASVFDKIRESSYPGVSLLDFPSLPREISPSLETLRAQQPENLNLDLVKEIDAYGPTEHKLWLAQWNHPAEADKEWNSMLDRFQKLVCPGSVAVDIGAHGGDTSLPLAAAVGTDGLVLAFEPGPPFEILKINLWINQALRLHAYNFAIDRVDGEWCYLSECDGCNGGKVQCGMRPGKEIRLVAHRLDEVLKTNYDPVVTESISFIKIDTEGFDADIVYSLKRMTVRPVVQVEWFDQYRRTKCSRGTVRMFKASHLMDYDVYVWDEQQSQFQMKISCEDLSPLLKITDFMLFPKEKPPINPEANGGMFRAC